MLPTITVDRDVCCHCGLCVQDCVVRAIALNDEEIPEYRAGKDKDCVGCQHCMAICPTGALFFGGKNPRDSLPVGYGKSEDLLRLIQSRRSVRAYTKEDVERSTMEHLIAMLPYIPTGGNADNLLYSFVGTRQKMDEVRKTTYETICATKDPSPLFLRVREAYAAGDDMIYRGAPAMLTVALDPAKTIHGCETADPIIALSYFELYAQSLGLGTLWCDLAVLVTKEIPALRALLDIPETHTIGYCMLFGYSAVRYVRTIQPAACAVRVL